MNSHRVSIVATTTTFDYRNFKIVDEDSGEGWAPDGADEWAIPLEQAIQVTSPYKNSEALLRLEEWDGEPGREPDDGRGPWDDDVTVDMEVTGANGNLAICQVFDWEDSGFSLSEPGRYHVRLSRRNGAAARRAYEDVMASFDEADWNGAECSRATEEINVKEEYLVRFWPAAD